MPSPPLIMGIYVFVPLIPSLMAPNYVGRLAISVWVLLFSLLGWVLWRGDSHEGRQLANIGSEQMRLT